METVGRVEVQTFEQVQNDASASQDHSELPGPVHAPAQTGAQVDEQYTDRGGGGARGQDAAGGNELEQGRHPAVSRGDDGAQHIEHAGELHQAGDRRPDSGGREVQAPLPRSDDVGAR